MHFVTGGACCSGMARLQILAKLGSRPEEYLQLLAQSCYLAALHANGLLEPIYRLHASRLKLLLQVIYRVPASMQVILHLDAEAFVCSRSGARGAVGNQQEDTASSPPLPRPFVPWGQLQSLRPAKDGSC